MKKCFVIGLVVLSYAVNVEAQIGTTPCASNAECAAFATSVCDTLTSGTCVCPTAQGYIANSDSSGCIYDCGDPPTITDGSRAYLGTVTDSQTFYSCDAGFQLTGSNMIACITVTGWETAPTCVAGKLDYICAGSTDVCANIANGECKNSQCACLPGYEDDGTKYACVEINECLTNPCTNGRICIDLINQYNCTCPTGYEGTNCQTNIDDCSEHACENGATCVDKVNDYKCTCPAGYDGTYCENDIDECITHMCDNGATCVDGVNGSMCECVQGWEGTFCREDIDDCASAPCQNDGTCTDIGNVFRCKCAPGFTGETCRPDVPVLKCPVNIDSRNTQWKEALPGQTRYKSCPNNVTGNVTRMCRSDGTWQLPQYNCVREVVDNINTQVNDILENVTTGSVEGVLKLIAIVTNQEDVTDVTLLLSDAELATLSTALVTVAEALNNLESSTVNTSTVANYFVTAASNLLESTNKDSWKSLIESNNDGASEVLTAVDTIGSVLTKDVQSGKIEVQVIVKNNIALEIKKVTETVRFPSPNTANTQSTEEEWVKISNSEIRLEQDSFPDDSGTTYVTTAVMYRDMSEILPTSTSVNDTSDENTLQINAPILALSVLPKIGKVDPPVRITFEHILKNTTNASCTFWEYGTNGRQGFWSDSGCRVNIVLTNDKQTVCECDHLTNFAVLMSPFVEPPPGGHTAALRLVSIIGISISALCLLVTIVVHICLWKNVRGTQATLLMNLCVALLLAYVVFLAGVDRIESKGFCAVVAALLHYIYLVVFGLMLAEGIELVFIVIVVFDTNTGNRPRKLVIAAWVLPAIIVGISLGATQVNGYRNDSFCWLSVGSGLIWAFIAPALTIILQYNNVQDWTSNLICLMIVFRQMCNMKAMESKTTKEKVKTTARSLCVLVPLMGVSWILGIFYINESLFFMQYFFAIVNGLQGFFIFLFHCLLNKRIKTGIKMKKRRRSAERETLKAASKSNIKNDKELKYAKDSSKNRSEVSNSESVDDSNVHIEMPTRGYQPAVALTADQH